jgi:AraC-like DNA-binding protein
MPIELTLSNEGPLNFLPGLPANYNGPILQGGVSLSAKVNTASVVLQELNGAEYSIRFWIGKFLKNIIGSRQILNRGLNSYFLLKGGLRKDVAALGKLHVRQDQYACFFSDPVLCKAQFEKDTEYKVLDIFYSPRLLQELLPFFPELNAVIGSTGPGLLSEKTCWMLPSMKEITNQLLNCPYNEATRQFYFDLKVRELLYQVLENSLKRNPTQHQYTPWEIARIHQARNIIESHISSKPPTIRSLSKQVALNEFKLKAGFRKFFNSGIFSWAMEKKMQHARQLLLTTDKPIKEIASLVGYKRTGNFITAFRKRFGMTPGSLRR